MTYAHFWPDIIAALRSEAKADDHRGAGGLCRDAADEIERLRAALFKIQTQQLNIASNTDMTRLMFREAAMDTRDAIIKILAPVT